MGLVLLSLPGATLGVVTLLWSLLVFLAAFIRPPNARYGRCMDPGSHLAFFPVHTTLLVLAYAAFFGSSGDHHVFLQEREAKTTKNRSRAEQIFHRLPSL